MIRTQYSNNVLKALAELREYAAKYPGMGLSDRINTLDNAGVFADLDEQTDYASAEEILAESAADAVEQELGKLDPEEWGDTTRAEQLTRQACTCGRPDERPLAPSLHAGDCPVWGIHHNLH